jgi:hypothetical protein
MERAEYGYRRRLIADEGRLWGGGPREFVPHDAYDETEHERWGRSSRLQCGGLAIGR